ncbi:Galactoside 3(4)-L-fucosyltransferase [Amphibalanus amphitrite]|uniref:Fucosyltransferase n=1 Tax=Amphibalanus amphitrite TaxID=1232801 RepID=A0A6A4UXN4_AMPAM|nr:Galactoside 3(4)-L-fucosyltransferase [Amphibalanus amphitrite]
MRCASFGSHGYLPYVVIVTLLFLLELTWLAWVHPRGRPVVLLASDATSNVSLRQLNSGTRPTTPFSHSTPGAPAILVSGHALTPLGNKRPLLVLHWTQRQSAAIGDGVNLRLDDNSFSGCPWNGCHGTGDRSLLARADAVLFHGRLLKIADLPPRRRPEQTFVFVLRESPQSTHLPLKKLDGFFNMTMTYSRDADVVFPYGQTAVGEQPGDLPFFHRRLRPVAWMVSHCRTVSKREQYVSQLRRHITVDTFGSCGDQRCPGPRLDCYRHLAETHLFYLSFENTLCDDYITEKFWLALEAGMVPVVRGPSSESYRRVAPPNSFIHVEAFAGPKALAVYLLSLAQNRTAYEKYHTWRRSHYVRRPQGLCDLCQQLSTSGHKEAVQLTSVWNATVQCHEPRDLDQET